MKTYGNLYRDPSKGKIAGVCAGLAEYFGIELWLVRILTLTGFFLLAPPFFFVGYIAAWFILEKKPRGVANRPKSDEVDYATHSQKSNGKGWHNTFEDEPEKVVVKSKVWQAGEPPKQAFFDIKQRFEKNEDRLRKMETYVTSSEFQLNRELSKL